MAGASAIARCRLARAPDRSPVSRSAMPRNACPPADPGSSRTLSRSSAIAFSRAAAVPQGRTEVVPGLGPLRTQDRGPLQVRQRGGQVPLLAEDEALQGVRLGMIGIEPEGLGQRRLPPS